MFLINLRQKLKMIFKILQKLIKKLLIIFLLQKNKLEILLLQLLGVLYVILVLNVKQVQTKHLELFQNLLVHKEDKVVHKEVREVQKEHIQQELQKLCFNKQQICNLRIQ